MTKRFSSLPPEGRVGVGASRRTPIMPAAYKRPPTPALPSGGREDA